MTPTHYHSSSRSRSLIREKGDQAVIDALHQHVAAIEATFEEPKQ